MTEKAGEELYTLNEICERFKGKIGKTRLVEHLKAVPAFAGGPTHRRIGNKYLFTDGDIDRLIESLAAGPIAEGKRQAESTLGLPSEERIYEALVKRLQAKQNLKPRKRKGSPG